MLQTPAANVFLVTLEQCVPWTIVWGIFHHRCRHHFRVSETMHPIIDLVIECLVDEHLEFIYGLWCSPACCCTHQPTHCHCTLPGTPPAVDKFQMNVAVFSLLWLKRPLPVSVTYIATLCENSDAIVTGRALSGAIEIFREQLKAFYVNVETPSAVATCVENVPVSLFLYGLHGHCFCYRPVAI